MVLYLNLKHRAIHQQNVFDSRETEMKDYKYITNFVLHQSTQHTVKMVHNGTYYNKTVLIEL